jgi:dolichol kinase
MKMTVLAAAVVLLILCISELGWRQNWLKGEFGRKFIHVTVGSFVAFWPFFLTWNQIRFMSLAFLAAVFVSQAFNIFHAINSVQRPTYGDVLFALIVGCLTFVTHHKGIYAAAILQMSLADGFAAIVGTRYGRDNKYRLFGHTKSVIGTATFLTFSLAILIGYSLLSVTGSVPWEVIVFGALMATVLENVASFGLDNVVVPLAIALLLIRF